MTKYEIARILRMIPWEYIDKECEIRGCSPTELDGWGVIQCITSYIIDLERMQ